MLNNIGDNIAQCGQQNIVQACLDLAWRPGTNSVNNSAWKNGIAGVPQEKLIHFAFFWQI